MSPRRPRGATPSAQTIGLTLDAGALIALERDVRRVAVLVRRALTTGTVRIPAGALGQVWRDGPRQALLGSLLSHPRAHVVPLDTATAKAAGTLCGRAGSKDVVDASVVICALSHGDRVLTSDPSDLLRLAPGLSLLDVSDTGG